MTLEGANVLMEHFLAAAAIIEQTAPAIMNAVGDLGVQEARRLVPYDTGATHDSITIVGGSGKNSSSTFGFRSAGEQQFFVEAGPETFYAPFLEYGTVHMPPRPFMLPALDLMEVALIASIEAIMRVVTTDNQGGDVFGGANQSSMPILTDPGVRAPFTAFRSFLYSTSKALGDVSVFGGRALFGPIRSEMNQMARILGDVSSTMTGTIQQRISRRLSGRVTGHIVGFGSRSLSFGKTYTAFPGGAGGHRIYQRIAGRYTNVRGVSAFGSSGMVNRLFG